MLKGLPEEIIKPVSKKEIFSTLTGILCVLLAANFLCAWHLNNIWRELGRDLILGKWDMLKNLDRPLDWLILGDSSGNQSFMPEVLNKTLNVSSANFCTVGGLVLLNDIWMIEKYREKFGPPKGVVLIHTADIWNRNLNKDAMALVPLPWGFWGKYRPAVRLTFNEKCRIFVQKYIPLYSSHGSFARKILSPRSTTPQPVQIGQDGFMLETIPNLEMTEIDKLSTLDQIKKRDKQISPVNLKALEELQRLAEEGNFEVYIVHGPLLDEIGREESFRSYFEKIKSEIKLSLQSKNRLHLVLEDPLVFQKHLMQSADHIIEPAARAYSEKVVRALKEKLGRVRPT